MPWAPVRSTQRAPASRSPSAVAIASRIAWSSALRLAGLEIVRRRTPSAGRSMSTSPLMGGNLRACGGRRRAGAGRATRARRGGGAPGPRRATRDRRACPPLSPLALLAEDLLDDARVLGLDRHLHLHRLEDDDGVALLDRLPPLAPGSPTPPPSWG